jgi:hypothetical protein
LAAQLTWGPVAGATGYRIYRRTPSGTYRYPVATIASGATTSFTDVGYQSNLNGNLAHVVASPVPGAFIATFAEEAGGRVTIGQPPLTLTVSPALIAARLAAGTNVVLQASNDLTVSDPVTVTPSGTPGNLTLAAGRSILVNASIATGGGNLTLTANDTAQDGVTDTLRDPGDAALTEAPGVTLDAGSGALAIDLKQSTDKTNNGQGVATLPRLSAASTTLSAATPLGVTINGTTPGDGSAGTYSQTIVNGSLILDGTVPGISHTAATPLGSTFTIIHTTGGVYGNFGGIPDGALVFASDGTPFTVSYHGNGGKDMVLTQVASPFRYDAASETLTITIPTPGTSFGYRQGSAVDGAGVLHTTYTLGVDNGTVSYPDSQVAHIVVNAQGSGDVAYLTTSDTYVGGDGQAHETAEGLMIGGGAGQLSKVDAQGATQLLAQLSGFAGIYGFLGPADGGIILGAAGGANTFVSAGGYAYMDSSPGFYFIGGAKYVYGLAAGAGDVAYHYDGSGPSALVISGTAYSFMTGTDKGQSFFNEAVGFQTTYGIATHPGQDTAIFYDSPDNDVFVGNTTTSYMYADQDDGSYVEFDYTQGFAQVYAYSFMGGIDYAYVYDTTVNHVSGFRSPG